MRHVALLSSSWRKHDEDKCKTVTKWRGIRKGEVESETELNQKEGTKKKTVRPAIKKRKGWVCMVVGSLRVNNNKEARKKNP